MNYELIEKLSQNSANISKVVWLSDDKQQARRNFVNIFLLPRVLTWSDLVLDQIAVDLTKYFYETETIFSMINLNKLKCHTRWHREM